MWAAAISVYVLAVFHRTSLGVAGLARRRALPHQLRPSWRRSRWSSCSSTPGCRSRSGRSWTAFGSSGCCVTGVTLMTVRPARLRVRRLVRGGHRGPGVRRDGRRHGLHQPAAARRPVVPAGRAPPMVTQVTGVLGQLGRSSRPRRRWPCALHAWGWTPSFATAAAVGVVLGVGSCWWSSRLARTPTTTATSSRSGPSPAALRLAWREPGTRLGPLVALLGPVRGQRLRAAVGLPVPRRRTGAVDRHGERPADADDGDHGRRQPDHRHVRHALARSPARRSCSGSSRAIMLSGPSCCCGRAGRRCRCWSCSSSSSPSAARARWSASTWPAPSTRRPASAAPPASSTSAASSRRCRRSP